MLRRRSGARVNRGDYALLFSALGDQTRLALITKLTCGEPRSISQLTEGIPLTRQAITKHLRVLEAAGLVRRGRDGRESLFALDPRPIISASEYLEFVSDQWSEALDRLKAFVER